MTDIEFRDWLIRGGKRCALIEVDTATTRFLSTVPYTTLPTDTPANQPYLPVAADGFAFTERLSLTGNPSISVGDIGLQNEDGSLDGWLNDVWTNRPIRVYIGDVSWVRADFKLVFSGLVAQLTASSPQRLSIVLRSALDRLNTPVTDLILGGATVNKDRLQPITLGECHNVTPLLTNPATHEYQFSQGASERVIEVRDEGVPVAATSVLANGRFRLGASPAGNITASVQGGTPYVNTISPLVQRLATQYGEVAQRLTADDLDAPQLAAFAAVHPQPVGSFLSDRANVLQVCQQFAASVGAQVVMSREGKLRLVKVALPGVGVPVAIGPTDYEHGTLSIRERPEVMSGVRLRYCKNWTVQETLNTGIPEEHKDLFAQEWLTVSARDNAVASTYRLSPDTPEEDTLLLRGVDAQAEANRRLELWKVQRTVYKLRGYAQCLLLNLGDAVTLTGNRFGLDAGKPGVVIGLQSDWVAGRCDVEVLV